MSEIFLKDFGWWRHDGLSEKTKKMSMERIERKRQIQTHRQKERMKVFTLVAQFGLKSIGSDYKAALVSNENSNPTSIFYIFHNKIYLQALLYQISFKLRN